MFLAVLENIFFAETGQFSLVCKVVNPVIVDHGARRSRELLALMVENIDPRTHDEALGVKLAECWHMSICTLHD